MRYYITSPEILALRSAAEQHGASEAELASLDRLPRGDAEDSDIKRLLPLAKLAGLTWGEYGPSPDFRCDVCGKSTGSSRKQSQPWEPSPCHWCARKERARDAARRRRQSPRVLGGVDVDEAVEHLRTVEPLKSLLDARRKIRVDVGHTADVGTLTCGGRAFISKTRPRMRVYGGPDVVPERVLEVVIHELCHLALPAGVSHGERFRRTFARAVREAWGVEVPVDLSRDGHKNASYRMGWLVIEQLRDLIASGSVNTYPPEPAEPKPSRAERSAELVERRAAHAAKMLAAAERKLKLAKTVHARWRTKVSYYERVAAKRGGA